MSPKLPNKLEGARARNNDRLANRSKNRKTSSKISNTEWGLVIGALAAVDLIQLGLDFAGIPFLASIGTLANRYIDLAVGLALPTYFYLRGVNMNAPRVLSIMLSLLLEEIPDLDALPLWTADAVYVMLSVKAEEKILEATGVDIGKLDHTKLKTRGDVANAFKEARAANKEGGTEQIAPPEGETGEAKKPTGIAAEGPSPANEPAGGAGTLDLSGQNRPKPTEAGQNTLNLRNPEQET